MKLPRRCEAELSEWGPQKPTCIFSYRSGAQMSQVASFLFFQVPPRVLVGVRPIRVEQRRAITAQHLQVASATCPRLGTKLTSEDVACTLSVRARDLLRIVCTPRKQWVTWPFEIPTLLGPTRGRSVRQQSSWLLAYTWPTNTPWAHVARQAVLANGIYPRVSLLFPDSFLFIST